MNRSMPAASTCPASHFTNWLSEMTKLPWFRNGGGVIGSRSCESGVSR